MKYNFDNPVDRRNTFSLKWDVGSNELPMWVADMDFQTAPEIIEALQERVAHGVFGYSIVPEEWYHAYMDWWKKRHGLKIKKDWLLFCTGVVPAISSIVRRLTQPNENVLIQTPVYNIFFNSVINNGRRVLDNTLQYDGENYHIDFEDLESKLADPQTTLMILCNPHNPVGKIWDRETLEKIGQLCEKHHVTVVSDEIHCDLTAPGCAYIPFASVSEACRRNSITCIAPTKTFNLAGLQTAAVVIPDEVLRHRVNRGLNNDEVAEPNVFAVTGAIAAFTKGEPWLLELREYVHANKQLAMEYIQKEIPQLKVVPSEATYLLWIDYSGLKLAEEELGEGEFAGFLRERTGLYLSEGEEFGNSGKVFLRMNVACPRKILEDGLERLKLGSFSGR